MTNHIETSAIETFAEPAYLAYAMKVVTDRAIPDIEDGLKPVQRRILYSMYNLKLLPQNAKPMKSARVVGDCFVAGALVHTAEGLKCIEDMNVGEYVRMPNGRPSKVVNAFKNKNSDVVTVCLSNGSSRTVTKGQLFRVVDDELNIQWCRADQLEGKRVLAARANFNMDVSDHPEIEIAHLGYAAGSTLFDCRTVQSPGSRVPKSILVDRRLFAAFIAGAIDASGYMKIGSDVEHSEIRFYASSQELIHQVQVMLMDLGVHGTSSASKVPTSFGHSTTFFSLGVSGLFASRLSSIALKHLQTDKRLAAEKLSLMSYMSAHDEKDNQKSHVKLQTLLGQYSLLSVVSVTDAGQADTYDVEIDDLTHEFLVDGCAVHNCLGRYHPHGDSAAYEAMVRMAQPFSLRYPLVHGEGNFGSRDGDSPAAMRYTECRLSPISAALLDELTWDTVDFKPTYDNSSTEPATLPARLPFLLLNGGSGIAVGMATNLFSHNLREVVEASKLLILKPKSTLADILALMPGPDFATGGRLISPTEEIAKVYDEGRGALRLRAQWTVEYSGKGNKDWRLVVTELPPDTSTAKIMIAINDLVDPQPTEKNGKKQPLKPEQLRLKKMFGDLIDEVRDGSDEHHPIHLIIEPKDRKSDPEALALALCAHTDMEMNVAPNFVCIDLLGNPRQAGLRDWLSQWCEYRVTTVRRRLTDEKARVDHRLHILAGRLSILDHIEEVIKILKKSTSPKTDLMARFNLDDIQAEDVLEMRLRSLANLEKIKLQDERAKLLIEQARLDKLLTDDKSLRKLIIKELDEDAKAFGDDRRTQLLPSEAISVRKHTEQVSTTSLMAPEPVGLVLTDRGWIGWRPAKSLEEAQSADYKIKAGDTIKRVYWGDRAQHLLLVSQTGRAYSIRLTDLPSKADMVPLTQFFDLAPNDKFAEAAVASPSDLFLLAGQGGYGFVVEAKDWINRMKAGKAMLKLGDTEGPLPPLPLTITPDTAIVAISSDGRGVSFPATDVSVLPKGKGVKLIGLAPGAVLNDVTSATPEAPALLAPTKGKSGPVDAQILADVFGPRVGKKGKALHKNALGAVFIRAGRYGWAAPPSSS